MPIFSLKQQQPIYNERGLCNHNTCTQTIGFGCNLAVVRSITSNKSCDVETWK